MLQIVQYQKTGEMLVEELPAPSCMQGGILVRTSYSLISAGTEKISVSNAQGNLLERARKQPDQVKIVLDNIKKEGLMQTYNRVTSKLNSYKSLGYSASGIVIESRCSEFNPGDRVACAGAGYANHAEIISVPKNLAVKLPDGVSLTSASYTTLGSIAMQGFRQAEPVLGETVAVIGLGLLGQITVQLLKAAGCRVVGLDVNESLFAKAKEYGCDETFPSSFEYAKSINSFARGIGCDSVIITASTASNSPLELALELCRKKGKVVIVGAVGLNVPRGPFYIKEIDLRIACSYGPGRYDTNYEEKGIDYPPAYVRWTENRNMTAFLDLLAMKKIDTDSMTSHVFKINDAANAYNIITGKTPEPFLGILIEYPERAGAESKISKLKDFAPIGKISIGFIGAGAFAQNNLLPALQKCNVGFQSVSTATSVNAKTAGDKFGFAECTTDSNTIIKDNKNNFIFIASQHDSHSKYVKAAIETGKPVFVEKPLAVNMIQLDETAKAVANHDGRVMVGFNRRFSQSFKAIEKFFEGRSEPMAITYRVNAGFIPKSHWVHSQGGRIVGEACHFIDCMVFLTKSLPVSIYAQSISSDNIETNNQDNVSLFIKFADGSSGVIQYLANGDSSLSKEYCEVFCERSCAVMDNFTKVELYRNGKIKTIKLDGKKGINEEVKEVVEAIEKGNSMPISFEELYSITKATIVAHDSLATNMPVKI